MRSLVSTSTHASQQGRVLSVVAFVEAVAALISPLVFGPLYAALVREGQEHWGFWICGCGCFVAWIVSWAMTTDAGVVLKDEVVVEQGREDGEPLSNEEESRE